MFQCWSRIDTLMVCAVATVFDAERMTVKFIWRERRDGWQWLLCGQRGILQPVVRWKFLLEISPVYSLLVERRACAATR